MEGVEDPPHLTMGKKGLQKYPARGKREKVGEKGREPQNRHNLFIKKEHRGYQKSTKL